MPRWSYPCPDAGGQAAGRHLAELTGEITGTGPHGHWLVEGSPLWCAATGESYGRITARCRSAVHGDLGCRMVRDGFALEWPRHGRACNE